MSFLMRYLKFPLLGFFCILPMIANSEISKDVLISSVKVDAVSGVKVYFLTMSNERLSGQGGAVECTDGFLLDIDNPAGKRFFALVLAAKTINGMSDIEYSTGCELTAFTLKYGQSVKGELL